MTFDDEGDNMERPEAKSRDARWEDVDVKCVQNSINKIVLRVKYQLIWVYIFFMSSIGVIPNVIEIMVNQLFHRLNLMHNNTKHAVACCLFVFSYLVLSFSTSFLSSCDMMMQSSLLNRYTPRTRDYTCEHFVYVSTNGFLREIIYRAKKRTRQSSTVLPRPSGIHYWINTHRVSKPNHPHIFSMGSVRKNREHLAWSRNQRKKLLPCDGLS